MVSCKEEDEIVPELEPALPSGMWNYNKIQYDSKDISGDTNNVGSSLDTTWVEQGGCLDNSTINFKPDSSFVEITGCDNSINQVEGTWKYSSNTLTMIYDDTNYTTFEEDSRKIIKMVKDTLITERIDTFDLASGTTFTLTQTTTFTK